MQEISQIKSVKSFSTAQIFAFVFLSCAALAATLIGAFPLQLSIITIFLFAGAHNFFEFRYFAARMPVRWGKSKFYYSFGIGGVIVLTAAYLAIYFAFDNWLWSLTDFPTLVSVWNTAFVLWVGALIYRHGRQKPRADYGWIFAPAFLLCAFVWLAPQYFSLSLVYLHPFVAMYFLERQMRRTKKDWLGAYRLCLLTIPVFSFNFIFRLCRRAGFIR